MSVCIIMIGIENTDDDIIQLASCSELHYFKLLHHLALPMIRPPLSSSAAPLRGYRMNKHIVVMFVQSKCKTA